MWALTVQTKRRRMVMLDVMRRARPEPAHPDAVRKLVAAVVALSDDPGPVNVERYLAASRALEESRPKRARRARTKTAPRTLQETRSDLAA
jgi:hypothetical protein